MPIIKLYALDKRENSTKRPEGEGTAVNVRFKDETSVLAPVIEISGVGDSLVNFNYAIIPEFGNRAYYVTWADLTANVWTATLTVDPLASFRANIFAESAFVLYSASNYNKSLMDHRVSQTTRTVYSAESKVSSNLIGADKYFISAASTSVSTLYNITAGQLTVIGQAISTAEGDLLDKLQKQFSAAQNAILEAYILPFGGSVEGESASIHLGELDTGATGKAVSTFEYSETISVPIPWKADDFRRSAPFTLMTLYLPFVGCIDLSPAEFFNTDSIKIKISVNIRLGVIYYMIYGASGLMTGYNPIATYTGSMKTNIPVSSYNSNAIGQAGGLLAVGAGIASIAASGGASAPAVAGIASGAVGGIRSSFEKTISTIGGYGGAGLGILGKDISLTLEYHPANVEPATLYPSIGGPLMERVPIRSLSGYVQTAGFSVSGTMTDREKAAINSALDGGVFIE